MRDSAYAQNPVQACRDGIYLGLATIPPDPTFPLGPIILADNGEVIFPTTTFTLSFNPIPRADSGDLLTYSDFFLLSWSHELTPGDEVDIWPGDTDDIVTVENCRIATRIPSVGTAFTYQGNLNEGSGDGNYDFQFKLFNVPHGVDR